MRYVEFKSILAEDCCCEVDSFDQKVLFTIFYKDDTYMKFFMVRFGNGVVLMDYNQAKFISFISYDLSDVDFYTNTMNDLNVDCEMVEAIYYSFLNEKASEIKFEEVE